MFTPLGHTEFACCERICLNLLEVFQLVRSNRFEQVQTGFGKFYKHYFTDSFNVQTVGVLRNTLYLTLIVHDAVSGPCANFVT